MNKHILISTLCAIPHVAKAQDLACNGTNPDWVLNITGSTATFTFDRTSEMQIMQDDVSENDAGIRAMTLVGPRDSAIVIYDGHGENATILTQRGQSPIILSGDCN